MAEETPSIVHIEADIKRVTFRKHQKEISLIADLLNIYINGFSMMPPFKRTEDNDLQYALLLLITRSFQTMRSASLLMLRGYYSSVLSLLRTVTEDWLIGRDCEHYQPTLDTLIHEKHRFGDRRLKLTYKDMAKRIGEKDRIGDITYQQDYGFQSRFIHAGRLSLAVMKDQGTNELRVSPNYNGLLFYACCESLMRNGLRMNEIMYYLLKSYSDEIVETWNKKVETTVLNIVDWLEAMRKKYGDKDTFNEEAD